MLKKAAGINNVGLRRILNITEMLKHVHNTRREKFSEPHVSFGEGCICFSQLWFPRISAPPPWSRPCLCTEGARVERCTDCPRLLNFSQHASSNGCVYNSALPSLCFLTFCGFPFRRPRGAGGWKRREALWSADPRFGPNPLHTVLRTYITQLSLCQNNHNVIEVPHNVDCAVA